MFHARVKYKFRSGTCEQRLFSQENDKRNRKLIFVTSVSGCPGKS